MSPLTTKPHIGKSLWTYRYSLAHNWKTHDVICKNRKFVTYLNVARAAEDWRDENLVKFGNAVSEICIGTDRDIQTDIHCYTERLIILLSFQRRTNERFNAVAIITGIFSQISQDILDRFLQSFHHMKALWVQMIDLYLVFLFVRGRCHGNQLIFGKCHERRLIPLAFFTLSFEQ